MKRISVLIITTLLSHVFLRGQSLSLSSDTTFVTSSADVTDVVAHATITNNKAFPVEVEWVRFVEEIPSGWDGTAVCDGNQCYLTHVSASPIPFTIDPGSSETFDVHFYPNDIPGNGTVQLRAWVVGDSANTVIVSTYKATAQEPVGIAAAQTEKIRIYPNPAKDYILIKNLPENEVSTVEVYNIFGRRMLSFSQAANNVDSVQKFDINTLAKGIYMIRVFDSAMNVIYTESLSKE
ncbi:MAG TPA: T9SS type A sorting domain-containing protein [Chitinophagales bacterium]|nr:T9SS type A sorting domain-containing protein [Chitinophagales bacterium]